MDKFFRKFLAVVIEWFVKLEQPKTELYFDDSEVRGLNYNQVIKVTIEFDEKGKE